MTPALTFVTTCKGRLQYLRQTLPLLAAHPSVQCIVVDVECPDHSGDWVEEALPLVTVVRSRDDGPFNVGRARNAGVAAARTESVCLIDADVCIAADFVPAIIAQFDRRQFLLPEPLSGDLSGTVVCSRTAFEFAEGYDEECAGWGGEDLDLYDRFEFHGLTRASFPARMLRALPHSDSERTVYRAFSDKSLSNSINLLYSQIKLDLMRLSASRLPAAYRGQLYAQVLAGCEASDRAGAAQLIEVPFSDGLINCCEIQTSLRYRIDVTRRDGRRGTEFAVSATTPNPAADN
ncbi:MAG: glycosyltransferase family A protein [Sphingomicrobium sp.]